ncbi:putative membrane protein [Lausannevirus]|uniref:Putative membrane protein n=1 Tax=Lausannevirus TaxID=999883 RepID=F2WKX3_9VIRU|nr:hypothetical protein LAU_0040 [Lausannevirus]AEA06896.1 putative membrane protein [Lausannevirus]
METLITACFGTSASLAITGFALCTWRTKLPNKRILGASNARLFEVDPNGARTVYALKGSEVSRVKSLGFQGKIHKKNILSIETLLKRPIYSSQRGTIQVKESTEPIYLSVCGKEEVATDNSEALERYISDYERNHKEQSTDSFDNVMAVCYLGSGFTLYSGLGLVVVDVLVQ